MKPPELSLLFAAIFAVMQLALTAGVIAQRLNARVDLLDGGDATLIRRIRAHGNFTETVPLALIMLVLLEMRGLGDSWLWILGGCLVLGRLLHALGLLLKGTRWARLAGMVLTLAVMSTLAVLCGLVFYR